MKLWPSILPRLHTTTTTSTNRRTLFTLVTASTVFLLSTQPPSTLASTPSFAGAHQRTFRLGRPAAGLNTDAPRFFSSMPVNLPSQNEAFDGFAQLPLEQPSESTAQLIRDAMDLFGAKPTAELFRRSWMPNAVFADPICHAEGSRQYLAQWYGMPAAFAKSETLEWKLVKQHDSEVQYVQKQRYTVKGLGTTKDMVSTVVMQRDAATGKITRFEDRWNHKPLGGYLSWPFRRLNAYTLPWLVGVPKETKQALDPKAKDR